MKLSFKKFICAALCGTMVLTTVPTQAAWYSLTNLFSSTKSRIAAALAIGALTYFWWTKPCTKNKPQEKAVADVLTDYLIAAATSNNIEAMQQAISWGADVNGLRESEKIDLAMHSKGSTVLMHACTPEAAELLIKSGADINYRATFNVYGRIYSETFLTHTFKYGSEILLKMLDMLLKTKPNSAEWVDTATHEGETLLTCAIRRGDVLVVKKLVEDACANIDLKSYNIMHPLVAAAKALECNCTEDLLEIIKYLLEKGANIDELKPFIQYNNPSASILRSLVEEYRNKDEAAQPVGNIAENNMTITDFISFAQHAQPHEILGIDVNAHKVTIRKAFRKLGVKFHPDKNSTEQEKAETAFMLVDKAREVMLKNFKR